MLTQTQAEAIAAALIASGVARECDLRCGLIEHLQDRNFSEWRLNIGKLFISGGSLWVSGSNTPDPDFNAKVRDANRRLADIVDAHALPLNVGYAHYREVKPLSPDMAESVWAAINRTVAPLDNKRKARFIQQLTSVTDAYIYVPTRNRQLGLNWYNDNFGFTLTFLGSPYNKPRLLDASVEMRRLFNAHCAAHNL